MGGGRGVEQSKSSLENFLPPPHSCRPRRGKKGEELGVKGGEEEKILAVNEREELCVSGHLAWDVCFKRS